MEVWVPSSLVQCSDLANYSLFNGCIVIVNQYYYSKKDIILYLNEVIFIGSVSRVL